MYGFRAVLSRHSLYFFNPYRHCQPFTRFLTVEQHQHNLTFHKCPNYWISERYSTSSKGLIKCWQCGIERANLQDLFCQKCDSIQSPSDENNFFKIFGLRESFAIDLKHLTSKYRQMQSVLHPDKFSTKNRDEKRISEDYSSLVNKAYDILSSPLKRALHLLALHGATIDEDQGVTDPVFLAEIMELNEEIESATNDNSSLKQLEQKSRTTLAKIVEEITRSFDNNDIEGAKRGVIKMKYYTSVSNHIGGLIRERGLVD